MWLWTDKPVQIDDHSWGAACDGTFPGVWVLYLGMEATAEREFSEFVARRHRDLLRAAFVLLGDRQRAEDLVQTALFRTFTAWSRLRSVGAAEAYARTTMVRLALRWRARRWVGEIATGEVPESSHLAAAEDAAVGVDVLRALRALPVEQRAVLVLRYLEDLTEAETASVLHCSIGTVKSRASRALMALRSAGLLDDMPEVPSHD